MYKIKNDKISVVVSKIGAELQEFKYLESNVLWSKNELWNKQSPILFPFIGALQDGCYKYDGNVYHMPTHGFIKDALFDVVYHSDECIVFKTTFSKETLELYPFKFEFFAEYKLCNTELHVSLSVKNIDEKPMYYGLGFHPGFVYDKEDSHLIMEEGQTNEVYFDPKFVYEIEKSLIKSKKMKDFSKELEEKRTICYQNLNSVCLTRKDYSLTIESNSIYTAFWQQRPENPKFICIESWNGMVDYLGSSFNIEEKPSLLKISAGDTSILKISFKIKGDK